MIHIHFHANLVQSYSQSIECIIISIITEQEHRSDISTI